LYAVLARLATHAQEPNERILNGFDARSLVACDRCCDAYQPHELLAVDAL
jgi:hypothetical protein